MSNTPIITMEDSLKERALQILNLRYTIEFDIKSSYKRRVLEYHPDRHPEAKGNPDKLLEYENKIKAINQSHELLMDVLHGIQIDISKYSLLEDWFSAVNFAEERETHTVREDCAGTLDRKLRRYAITSCAKGIQTLFDGLIYEFLIDFSEFYSYKTGFLIVTNSRKLKIKQIFS